MMGFGNSGVAHLFSSPFYGTGTGPVITGYPYCNGNEANLTLCRGSLSLSTTQSHNYDVSLSCTRTKIRLMDGDSKTSGRIELFIKGAWTSVCDSYSYVGTAEASVFCSMLGYGDTGIVKPFPDAPFGVGSGRVMLTSLNCNGNEIDIMQCGPDFGASSSCNHRKDAGVSCGATGIRLVGGPSPDIGRVEILHGGSWGTICSSGTSFDRRNAMVICRMLGYNASHAFGHNNAFYGEGHGPVITYNLNCDGSEADIASCPSSGTWHTSSSTSPHCAHSKDVGVNCKGVSKVRLSDGDSNQSGRVEVYRNGHWGTMSSYNFDNHDLEVICRMLDYQYTTQSFFLPNSYYGQGTGDVVVDDLQCDGVEADIGLCHKARWWPNSYTSSSNHNNDVGISCDGVIPMRVVDGPTNGTGRLEILHNGYYGTVCDQDFDRLDLIVVCRTLGYESIPRSAYFHGGAYYGQGLGEILVSDLACNGVEKNIGQCGGKWPAVSYCDHGDDLSVSCDGGFENVRLGNGTNNYSGRVEILHDGQWQSICYSGFDRADAVVACRMMGFSHPEHARAFVKSEFGKGTGKLMMSDLKCNGLESSLDHCRPTLSSFYCSGSNVAGVDCCPSCDGAPQFVVG